MPDGATLERFIARVLDNQYCEAIAEFYAEHASMQENQSEPRRGRSNLVERERALLEKAQAVRSERIGPVFVSGDHVVIRWRFRFDWNDGSVTEMEELAYQRWDGDLIVEEQFFYDPAQRQPRRPIS
jgi:hypothetical protein